MAKRNARRERERLKALARQEKLVATARRRRRNQIIAGVLVATLAVGGAATAIVFSILNIKDNKQAADLPTDLPTADLLTDEPSAPTPQPTYTAVPDPALAEGRQWTGSISTSAGQLGITLEGDLAPQASANFIQLARDGYYNGSSCHRLTTDGLWVLQCGSLTGDGTDNPGYQFGPLENVPADEVYPAGTIAMARAAAEDSQGSQFFIVYQPTTLPGGYSVFGHVTSGLEIIEEVAAAGTADGSTDGAPATTVTIDGIELS
ncbi:MAG: peptidylprolyl isomerase [Bifidobacteriaceae bacterium]|jgi:peptidyl-prolyl cis-trans isomerase B (cyclophilin B)|nr:peptidylprolyl isomerase [Bifidobacteriaceae bacterium]